MVESSGTPDPWGPEAPGGAAGPGATHVSSGPPTHGPAAEDGPGGGSGHLD
jgi:hypothetical protein